MTESKPQRTVDLVTAKIQVSQAIAMLRSPHQDRLLQAAAMIAKTFGAGGKMDRIDEVQATKFLLDFVRWCIDRRKFGWATSLLWPKEMITFGPHCVQKLWATLNEPQVSELLVMGAGSLGKSYTIGIWSMMDWIYDPEGTCFKIVSMTAQHASRNMFAIMKNLHANCLIPLPGTVKATSIDIERADGSKDDKHGIHLVAIPHGENGSGRLQGFHPQPRIMAHHRYGMSTRVRVILDEAEEIGIGVWDDVDNTLISKTPEGHVKVIGSTNPVDRTSKFGERAEPVGGWEALDIETAYEWGSKLGWRVLRLDGAKFENVVQKKIVFPGFLTLEGYERYLRLGPGSPTYYTMARGYFPETGVSGVIIPQNIWDRGKGQFMFQGRTFYCLSLDLAFEGGDLAIGTIGRWGVVTGWSDRLGRMTEFVVPRHGLQIEQQFELRKQDSVKMVDEFAQTAKVLNIKGEWMVIDKTSATTFFDLLKAKMNGADVLGINYGEGATELPIMEETPEKANELYKGIVTELWFSGRQFLEFDLIKFGPLVRMDKIEKQAVGRRYKHTKDLVQVEPKKEYKARGNNSPDEMDSALQMIHLVRMRREFIARMIAVSPMNEDVDISQGDHGIVDRLRFIDMSS